VLTLNDVFKSAAHMKKLVLDVINAARYQARFLERGGSHPDTTNTLQVSPHVLAVVVRALGLTLRMHQPCTP